MTREEWARTKKEKGMKLYTKKSKVQKGGKDYLEKELDGEYKRAAILRRHRREHGNDTSSCP